ncbi:MAG: protoporphyrinogen oxidase [Longimicrobiales bacterium]|nr:protoporphyrinogen oxidase [Longimicrobiales bacterium]
MIAVVGGGITGLATGFELDRIGADFVVLEARDRPGGVIRSDVVDGSVLDWGPQRARLTASLRRMIDALGLESEVVTAPADLDLYIYRAGRLRRLPFNVARFAFSDVVSLGAKLRALAEPFTTEARPDERVADFFTRKFGRELYETVIGPLYGGLYASDPRNMEVGLSLIHVLREFGIGRSLLLRLLGRGGAIQAPPACSFTGGMQVLPDALARSLGRRFRRRTPVRALTLGGGGWRVETDSGEVLEASDVVLTTPAPVTAGLLESIVPRTSSAIAQLRYNPLVVAHVRADTDLRGIGFKVSFAEEDMLLTGVTFNESLFAREKLYTAYMGGARNPQVTSMSHEELSVRVLDEFRRTTGFEGRLLSLQHERMPAWDLSWRGLRDLDVPPGLHIAGNWWSRPGLPGRLAEAASLVRKLGPEPVEVPPALVRG